jgi:hypothetical protein
MTLIKQKTNLKVLKSHNKRVALHHRKTIHYYKPYYPYLPLLIFLVLGIFGASTFQPNNSSGSGAQKGDISSIPNSIFASIKGYSGVNNLLFITIITIILGVLVIILALRHSSNIKNIINRSEKLISKNIFLDILLVVGIIASYSLIRVA